MDKANKLIISNINNLKIQNFAMGLKLDTGLYKSFEEMKQLKQNIKENKKIIDLYNKLLKDLKDLEE